jgi:hypothetical protein
MTPWFLDWSVYREAAPPPTVTLKMSEGRFNTLRYIVELAETVDRSGQALQLSSVLRGMIV